MYSAANEFQVVWLAGAWDFSWVQYLSVHTLGSLEKAALGKRFLFLKLAHVILVCCLHIWVYIQCLTVWILNLRCVCKNGKLSVNPTFLIFMRQGLDTFHS